MRRSYQKTIHVYCNTCKVWINEKEVEFLNIEEGMRGEDRLTFKCPVCEQKSTSSRVG